MADFVRFGFGSGLMSSDLRGRVDLEQYHRSCSELLNMEVLQSGAVRRRCGSRFLAELSARPAAMGVFLWSSGVLGVVLVFESRLEVRGEDGVVLFRAGYASGGGMVRLLQINDLVVVVCDRAAPMQLRNVGGVFEFSVISWRHVPMEGNWARNFPLYFHSGVCRVCSAWDSLVRIGSSNQCFKARYKGVAFTPGMRVAVRSMLPEFVYSFSMRSGVWLGEAVLSSGSYEVGALLYFRNGDHYSYWSCVMKWVPRAGAFDPAEWPEFFAAGVDCWSSPVSGGFELDCKSHSSWYEFAVQESAAGGWQDVVVANLGALPSDHHIYTGDMDGEPARLRLALKRSTNLVSGDVNGKVALRRKAARMVWSLVVSYVYDDGSLRYVVEGFGDWFGDVRSAADWDVQAFSAANGFPSVAAYHGGRLVFAGTEAQPQSLWFSAVDDLYNFRTGGNDADAMVLSLSGAAQSRVVWAASSGAALLVGTSAGEVVVRGGGGNGVLSAASAVASNHSSCGSAVGGDVLLASDALLFVDRSGRRLRRLCFSMESDLYFARDLSVFSYGVLSGGVRSVCWQRSPQPVAWVVPDVGVNAGALAGMLYNPDQQLCSWFLWSLGAEVMSVGCAASGRDVDPLFVCVQRVKRVPAGTVDPPVDPGEPGDPDPEDPVPPVEPPKVPVEVVKDYVYHGVDLHGFLSDFGRSKFFWCDVDLRVSAPDPDVVFSGFPNPLKMEGFHFAVKEEGSGFYRFDFDKLEMKSIWEPGKPMVEAWFFVQESFPFPGLPLVHFFDLPVVFVPAGHFWRFKALGGWRGKLYLRQSGNGVNFSDFGVYESDCVVESSASSGVWLQVRLYGYSRRDGFWAGETAFESWRVEVEYVDAGSGAASAALAVLSAVDGGGDAGSGDEVELVDVPMWCLEVLDWAERDVDCAGCEGKEAPFAAVVVASPMDVMQFFGKKLSVPVVDLLVDGVDVAGAEVCSGSGAWSPVPPSLSGDGWCRALSLSNGGFVRAVGVRLSAGHGMVIAGRVCNG